ncbi:MAG: helix-turn-helix transcriptional regulator [Alphaproteobacteria bacterium]
MQDTRLAVRQRIREFRVRAGLTQAELAEQVGTTAATVSRLETNAMTVSTDWLERFAAVLRVHPADLIARPGIQGARLLGKAGRAGRVAPANPDAELSVDLPADAVAVEVAVAQGPYAEGDQLIGARLSGASILSGVGRDCIVALRDGSVLLGRVAGAPPRLTLIPSTPGDPILYDQDVEWLAPIAISIRKLD